MGDIWDDVKEGKVEPPSFVTLHDAEGSPYLLCRRGVFSFKHHLNKKQLLQLLGDLAAAASRMVK